jgi:ElaB/YqjD/DUF883 family membrane-anchored ribosome-binding protein
LLSKCLLTAGILEILISNKACQDRKGRIYISTNCEHFADQVRLLYRRQQFCLAEGEKEKMSEFEEEVRKAERELNEQLVPVEGELEGTAGQDEFLGDLKMQAQEFGNKVQDAAVRARDYASERFARAGEKFNELKEKDPRQLVEEAKQYAREKPGHAILISAAAGLVLGLLLRRR